MIVGILRTKVRHWKITTVDPGGLRRWMMGKKRLQFASKALETKVIVSLIKSQKIPHPFNA